MKVYLINMKRMHDNAYFQMSSDFMNFIILGVFECIDGVFSGDINRGDNKQVRKKDFDIFICVLMAL